MRRVPLIAPLTPQEKIVVALTGRLQNYNAIAEELQIGRLTVKDHAENAAKKIPGDLPAQVKLAMWYAGAPIEVLTRRLVKFPHVLEGEEWPVREGARKPGRWPDAETPPPAEDGAVTVTSR